MSEHDPKNQAAQGNLRGTEIACNSNRTPDGDYIVGKNRPPAHSRFKPGQSGNPKGRPKGRRNVASELKEIVSKKVKIRDGNKDRYVSLTGANVLAHAIKGAQGEVRSAALFLNQLDKFRLINEDDGEVDNAAHSAQADPIMVAPANQSSPSDTLFEGLDLNRLSRGDQLELWHLAKIIDLGGDFTALSVGDFERLKVILNKGRGKDVTPR